MPFSCFNLYMLCSTTKHSCSGGLPSRVTLEVKREDLLREDSQTAVQLLNVVSSIKLDFLSHLLYALRILRGAEISTQVQKWQVPARKAHGQWRVCWSCGAHRQNKSFPLKPAVREQNYFHTETVDKYLRCLSQPCVVRGKYFQSSEGPEKGPQGVINQLPELTFTSDFRHKQGGLGFFLALCPSHWLLKLSPSSTCQIPWAVEAGDSWRGVFGRSWLFWTRERGWTLKYLKWLQISVCEHIIQ